MDERRRYLIKIVMLMRVDMRELFGMEVANRWGFWVDRYLSKQVRDFADWIPYPKGDHVLTDNQFQMGHKDIIFAVAVSSDGRSLFTGSNDKTIVVWNMLNHRIIKNWRAHDRGIASLAYKGGLLVSGSNDKSTKIWDTMNKYALVHTLKQSGLISSVGINDKATQVVSGSLDKSIRIWSVKTGECNRVLIGHSRSVTTVQFFGNLILSGSDDRSMKVWNPSDGTEIRSISEGKRDGIYDLSINSNSSLIACILGKSGISILTVPDMKPIRTIAGNCERGAFHSARPNIIAVDEVNEYSIRIYDVTNGELIRTLEGHTKWIYRFCFTPDGQRLISVAFDKTVRVWDTSDL